MADRSVGFIGVGRMGGRLARRLIEAGYRLTIFDTSADTVRPFVEMGAEAASSVAAVASACEVVITCLPTPAVVQAVALGAGGLIEGSRIKIFIDMSTTGATYARRIAEGLRAKGIIAVDAPISGGLAGRSGGRLPSWSPVRKICCRRYARSWRSSERCSLSGGSLGWVRR